MNENTGLVDELRTRVRELEGKLEALRISRRVLMSLIDALEKEKSEQLAKLTSQNQRLQKNNCRYARTLMHRNSRITELEEQLRLLTGGKNRTGNTSV